MKHEPLPTVAEPTVNVVNILRVADAIERHEVPGLGFNMEAFYGRVSVVGVEDIEGRSCDTVACISGWTRAVFPAQYGQPNAWMSHDVTAGILGLNQDQQRRLFFQEAGPDYTPVGPNGLNYADSETTPAQAVRTLRHLAATGEVNWNLPEA